MWLKSSTLGKKDVKDFRDGGGGGGRVVAVAIDKDKNSQYALRWTLDNLVSRGRALVLLHVTLGQASTTLGGTSAIISAEESGTAPNSSQVDKPTRDLYHSFRCLCLRKNVRCLDITLRDTDVARALIEYANYAVIENLVLGSDFTTVHVISKTKISSVQVLSCIRHPNMVLLLGACPEYGCLVYEYMANGSLEDRLFCKGGTPPLNWQTRFRIAEEITTGLLFLHQTKPEPLVHRDLKPANILLDRYFVSKIGDVGLARLVPPSVADNVTRYRMTSTAGTFCYIDPEYQQTGMLGVKSDVYSLGVVLLQLLTAKPPMGLAYHVNGCIENGTFDKILDPSVPDWPIEQALVLAKLAVQCAAMMKKDRPDLGKEVFPELTKLRDFADDRMQPFMFYTKANPSPHFQ